MPIEQLIAPGAVAARSLLPSVRYHPAEGELAEADRRLPWDWADPGGVAAAILGELAQERGSRTPGRLVASAKSWLSHPGVDRTAPILPWGVASDIAKVSPVAASASYLAHVRAAWNQRFARHPLERQDVVLTVPASFDEGARVLTVHAARQAGLERLLLLEEPQAACYDWLHRHRNQTATALGEARLLLVCDVGGGTTDLTLIQIEQQPNSTTPILTRIGVGQHLMLGGDNMDLALARVAESRLSGVRLSAGELSQLWQQCRIAKERLLAHDGPEQLNVTVLGSGARLIGEARSAPLRREETHTLLVDGFFPMVDPDDAPQARRAAVVEFGLPYAADPAVSRHLAAFLARYATVARQALGDSVAPNAPPIPDTVLLNGGVFRSEALAERLLAVLAHWRGAPLAKLDNPEPDLAVARGAVAYGLARRGQGLRIGGGASHGYFLAVEGERGQRTGVCLLPRGAEEGQEIWLEREFLLRIGTPVQFDLLASTGEGIVPPGALVKLDTEEFTPLPPVATLIEGLSGADQVPVRLRAQLTATGTLDLSCVAVDDATRRWELAFQLRGDPAALARLPARFNQATAAIERFYGSRVATVAEREIKGLRHELERLLGKRDQWEPPLLRELFTVLWNGARRRRRSAEHERLWFSLTGYCLRPGWGYPLDAWRVGQLWTLYPAGVQYRQDAQNRAEWWTLWRRVAGGLDRAAQERLSDDLLGSLGQLPASGRAAKEKAPELEDRVRLLGVLERVSAMRKVQAGEWLLARLTVRQAEAPALWWALGRLGNRVPTYGSAHDSVPADVAATWLEQVLALDWRTAAPAAFAAALLARRSGDRARDLAEDVREHTLERLRRAKAPESWLRLVEEVAELTEADITQVFGEALPPGLRLLD